MYSSSFNINQSNSEKKLPQLHKEKFVFVINKNKYIEKTPY